MKNNFDNFNYALSKALNIEAGYSDNENDNGGKTNFGITEAAARRYGYTGSMKDLPKETAIEIYKKLYWDRYNLDLIQDKNISAEVFEFGINAGMRTACKVLQRAFNVLSHSEILVEDGVIGKITSSKINNYEYPETFVKIQNILQGMFYIGLAEGNSEIVDMIRHHSAVDGNKKYKTFIRGWIDKRVEI